MIQTGNKFSLTAFISALFILLSLFITLSCNKTRPIPYISESYSTGRTEWTMIRLPATKFPGGPLGTLAGREERPDIIGTDRDIWMAETNTTYALWSEVFAWAVDNGYRFNRPGRMGSERSLEEIDIFENEFGRLKIKGGGTDGIDHIEEMKKRSSLMNPRHPVTVVDRNSAMVWCNALTEYYNEKKGSKLRPVYRMGSSENEDPGTGKIIRDATDRKKCDNVIMEKNTNGFRLPLGPEWELAARYTTENPNGTYPEYPAKSGIYWKSFLEVSGELEAAQGKEQGGGIIGRLITVEVKETEKNSLGFYGFDGDNGKLWQWCFEYLGETDIDSYYLKRGGSRGPRCSRHDNWPKTKWSPTCGNYSQITFRVVRDDIE